MLLEETQIAGNNAETATATNEEPNTVEPTQPTEPVVQEETKEEIKEFTRSQVVEMMKKRIARSHNNFFKRYGVKDLDELDAKYKSIDDYKTQISDLEVKNAGLVKTNAYLTHNINPDRYGDIEAYFKGKDLKIDTDTLASEISTHPEWIKQIAQPAPTTTISTMGPVDRGHTIVETEDEKMKRTFGI